MNFKEKQNILPPVVVSPKLRLVERDCPRCEGVLLQNAKEECFECHTCGYIDCGCE